jgi:CRISPR-associated endoribonuclease Cas6
MYFLAALLTLKAMEPDRSPSHLADYDASLPSRQELRFKDAQLREDQMTAALLSSAAGQTLIRLTCWSKARDTPASVLQALTSRPRIEFAQQLYAVESVDLVDPLWADLQKAWQGVRMRFTFATPLVTARREQGTESKWCMLSEYRLETAENTAQTQAHPGFLGWVEYACRAGEITAIASLNALARLAFFTGSGYLTALGMGTSAVTIAN